MPSFGGAYRPRLCKYQPSADRNQGRGPRHLGSNRTASPELLDFTGGESPIAQDFIAVFAQSGGRSLDLRLCPGKPRRGGRLDHAGVVHEGLSGALDMVSACASVLATTKSTPCNPAVIMLLTALPPAPPTPNTVIRGFSSRISGTLI